MDGTRVQSWSCKAADHWIYRDITGPGDEGWSWVHRYYTFFEGGSSEEFVVEG